MKSIMIVFMLLLTTVAFSQKKSETQAQLDTLKKANQKLTDQNKSLTLQSDSLSKELAKYFDLYKVIKDKVVKMDFDPAKMSNIIDSLKAGRDSLQLSSASSLLLRDTINVMGKEIDSLRKETQGLMYAVKLLRGGSGTNPTEAADFAGKWNLILRKVKVTGQSPKAAVLDISSDPVPKTANVLETNPIASINFVDKEIAELILTNGDVAKTFYEIVEFNKTKPYYIDFKGTKADLRVYFMNTPTGPRISFEIPGSPGSYYFGMITK